jgi:hypothetical protein
MKTNKTIFGMAILLIASCSFFPIPMPEGYKKYQTFDEYSLQGVTKEEHIQEPFVYIKEKRDSIYVLLSNQGKIDPVVGVNRGYKPLLYINKGDYWYNISMEKQEYIPDCRCDTSATNYFVKFIYGDTILTYHYFIAQNKIYEGDGSSLDVDTKDASIHILLADDKRGYLNGLENGFERLRKIAHNYEKIYPRKNIISDEYQPTYYEYYSKILSNDTLFLYKDNGISRYLYQIWKLSSLGVFIKEEGREISTDYLKNNERCK